MSAAVDLVAKHLAAVWISDWDALEQSLSRRADLRISDGAQVHSEWTVSGFYRHLTQAWDFAPGTVQLADKGNGIVVAKMCLTNGGDWSKEIEGVYRVGGDRIDFIDIVDRRAVRIASVDPRR